MSWPGPSALGRGVVVRADAPVPDAWAGAPEIALSPDALSTEPAAIIDRLHRAWVERDANVIRWNLDDDALQSDERDDRPPWRLDPDFLFPLERLRFLVFSNNYDARDGVPKWWWSTKAIHRGASDGGAGDVLLPDGAPAWIDGGARRPLPTFDLDVVHGESVEAGTWARVPTPIGPEPDGLAADQLDAAGHFAGPARIIAPAGSGKTRTLAARVRHLLHARAVEPEHLIAVAYNARAAGELRDRLGAGRSTVRTIHSLGWAILGEIRPGLELMPENDVRSLLTGLLSIPKRPNADPIGPYLEALEEVRAGLRDPAAVESSRDDVPGLADAFEGYRRSMYRRGAVDHGEQVYGAIEALLGDSALRGRWQRRCRHLLVDEFQDLTPAYLLLLRLVASPELQVFGVGDDDQVIYGYAGADPGFLIDFDRYFPASGAHALETNYRSPAAVVEATTHLLAYNQRRITKTIHAAPDAVSGSGAFAVLERPGAGLAREAADRVRGWLDNGVAPHEIAVLARVNAALIPVKAALVDAGVPTADLLTPQSLNRTVARAAFAWLRIALSPERMGRSDLLEAVRRPSRGLTGVTRDLVNRRHISLDQAAALAAALDGKRAVRWSEFVADIEAMVRVAEAGDSETAVDRLTATIGLAASARTLDSGRGNAARSAHQDDLVAIRRAAALHVDLATFMPWLRDAVARPADTAGVTLSSVHRVKGMEWQRVIVFAADRGAMPHELSDDLEEERRVFHVAITRSSEETVVLADASRPSRFLRELDGSAPKQEPAPRTPHARPARPQVRKGDEVSIRSGYVGTVVAVTPETVWLRLATGAEMTVSATAVKAVTRRAPAAVEADQVLVEALKAWRLETSRTRGVPAYVVLHDSTLTEIAATKPRTERELLTVSGVGARKLEDYGDEILAIVEATG